VERSAAADDFIRFLDPEANRHAGVRISLQPSLALLEGQENWRDAPTFLGFEGCLAAFPKFVLTCFKKPGHHFLSMQTGSSGLNMTGYTYAYL